MSRIVHKNVYWRLTGKVTRYTDKAVLMAITSIQGMSIKTAPAWFPRSQIEGLCIGGDVEEDSFDATKWILEQKGFASDMAKITSAPQRVLVDRFAEETVQPPAHVYAVKEKLARDFEEFDDDLPF
jgi:hypothetical protein